MGGPLPRLGRQLAVGELAAVELDRHPLGRPRRLLGDRLVEAGRRWIGDRGVVPFAERLGFGGREEGELREPPARIGSGGSEEVFEVPGEALRRRAVEEVGTVFEPAAQLPPGIGERQGEVEERRGAPGSLRVEGEAGEGQLSSPGNEEAAHGLEERRSPQAALGVELFHQLAERQLLVGEGRHHPLAQTRQEFPESGIAGEIGTEDQGVDEKADQPLGLPAVAAGHGGADGEIGLPRQPGEEGEERRRHGHQEGRPGAPAERPQAVGQRRADGHRNAPPRWAGHRRPRPVDGEGQGRWRFAELPPPVGERPVEHRSHQGLALPGGEIGILEGQLGQGGRQAAGEGGIEGRELADQDPARPAVRSDVVDGEDEGVLPGGQAEQLNPEHRAAFEVERTARLGGREMPRLLLPPGGGKGGEVGQGDRHGGRRLDDLDRPAEALAVGGAEHLVPADDFRQGGDEETAVEIAAEAERGGQVVGGAPRLQAVDQPQPLLGKREREGVLPSPWSTRQGEDRRAQGIDPLLCEEQGEEPPLLLVEGGR